MQIRDTKSIVKLRQQTLSDSPRRISFSSKRIWLLCLVAITIGFALILHHGTTHAINNPNAITSGWKGYCLDDYHGSNGPNAQLDIWSCNGSSSQVFTLNMTQIKHNNEQCLTAESAIKIDLSTCNNMANQVWLRDQGSFFNPKLRLCLSALEPSNGTLLSLTPCANLNTAAKSWSTNFNFLNYNCHGSEGAIVACNAIKQWIIWQDKPLNHENLLTLYTGGASYEEWCADFVSYIYKVSNYPFSNGNYAGWDENDANQIVNQGFNFHAVGTGYLPSPGDVAYFNYNGGHVEIVIVGGKQPTFIYGDSATIDPTTNNGQMEANTILGEKNLGSIQYYLSPTTGS